MRCLCIFGGRSYRNESSKSSQPGRDGCTQKEVIESNTKAIFDCPEKRLRSLISYFGVPKGIIDDIVQDELIIYHTGANGLDAKYGAPHSGYQG